MTDENQLLARLDERTKRHNQEIECMKETQDKLVAQMQQMKWIAICYVVATVADKFGLTELLKMLG